MAAAGRWAEGDLGRRCHRSRAPSGRPFHDGARPQLGSDEVARCGDVADAHAQRQGDRAEPAGRQRGQVVGDDGACNGMACAPAAEGIELSQQTLAQAAGCRPWRPRVAKSRDDALHPLRRVAELAGENVDRHGKEAAGREAARDGFRERVVGRRQQQARGPGEQLGVARLVRQRLSEIVGPRAAGPRSVGDWQSLERGVARDLPLDELLERVRGQRKRLRELDERR